MAKRTMAQAVTEGEYWETLSRDGWHIASRLSDKAPILVNSAATQIYDFRKSLLGLAIQPY